MNTNKKIYFSSPTSVGSLKWGLLCAVMVWLWSFGSHPPLLLAMQTSQTRFVTQEFRYQMPEAGEVYLVWGLNGWQLAPEEIYPAETAVEFGVMHTPMVLDGEWFVAKVQVPMGTTVDYGFQTRKKRIGTPIEWVWDGDYQISAVQNDVIDMHTKVTLSGAKEYLADFNLGPYLLLGVSFLWGIFLLYRRNVRPDAWQRSVHPAAAIGCIGVSLSIFLLLIRAHILGFSWISFRVSTRFIPEVLAAGSQDLFYVCVTVALFVGCWLLLRKYSRASHRLIIVYYAVALFSLLLGVVNIQAVRMLGQPVTYQWVYYANFLTGVDAYNAISANVNNAILLNMVTLSMAMLIASRILIGMISLLPAPLPKRGLLIAIVVPLCLYFPFANWYSDVREQTAPRLANPVVAFLESIMLSNAQPDLFTMPVGDDAFQEFHIGNDSEFLDNSIQYEAATEIENVIVFTLESVPAEYTEPYGGAYPVTPNLEQYRSHSLLFRNIYAHAPASNKALTSILSAVHPWISYRSLTQEYPEVEWPTLSSELKNSGYRTAFFSAGDTKFQRGDEYLAHQQFDTIKDYHNLDCERQRMDLEWDHSDGLDEECLIDAFSTWQHEDPEQPFFTMMWTVSTHYPYFVIGEEHDYGVGDAAFNRYLNALHHNDKALGQLLHLLEQRELSASTLVVVVGDHGEAFGRHDQIGHAAKIYEENLHVPLIFINPRFRGEENLTVGGHVDVAPTILSLLNRPVPVGWQGQSLLSTQRSDRVYFFAPWSDFLFGYREGNLKFIYNATTNQSEIYNLLADPYETTNLVNQMPDAVPVAHQHLAAWVQYHEAFMNELMEEGGSSTNGLAGLTPNVALIQRQISAGISSAKMPLFVAFSLVLAVGTVFVMRTALVLPHFQLPPFFQRLVYLRDLLGELVARDFKLRYKRSVLGVIWSLLNPLAQLLVLYFIFGAVVPLNIPNYAMFLFTGLLVWTWFQTSLLTASSVIVDNPDLIRRPGFPVAILPVVTVVIHHIHFLLALPILLIFLVYSGIQITGAIVALPLLILLQFLLTLSLAYLVAAMHVVFRDTQYLLGIFLMFGFYLSPIFYATAIIPERYQFLYHLNPMVDLIDAYRALLMQGTLPDVTPLLIIGVVATGLLWLGYKNFMRTSYRFVEEL